MRQVHLRHHAQVHNTAARVIRVQIATCIASGFQYHVRIQQTRNHFELRPGKAAVSNWHCI